MNNKTAPPSWENSPSWAEQEIARWSQPKVSGYDVPETLLKDSGLNAIPKRVEPDEPEPIKQEFTLTAPAGIHAKQPLPTQQIIPEEKCKRNGNRLLLGVIAFLIYWSMMLSPVFVAVFVYSKTSIEYVWLLVLLIPVMPIPAYLASNKSTKGKSQVAIQICIGIYGFFVWNYISHGLRSVLFSENFWIAIIVIIVLAVPIELTFYWSIKKEAGDTPKKKRTKVSDPASVS